MARLCGKDKILFARCGRSSAVERHLAKVEVEGSIPFARSIFLHKVYHVSKPRKHWSVTAAIHALTTAAAHLPCCGTKLFITFFGAQFLGVATTRFLHEIELYVPPVTTAILAIGFMILQNRKQKQDACCPVGGTHHHHKHALLHFILGNLVIGYCLVAVVHFLFHHHH